ncbi:MAG: histidine ammonia-lyase [Formosa sp.]|jgi:histidine ammonia-lyase|nr:histidine ammonia-lyase [Formosa sp.]|tara:strand:- start:3899 stop:5398 length:1500 start_codon:yes stop_codon:yes gene_type:complete
MYTISSQPFSLSILNRIVSEQLKIKLSEEIKENIINCRKYLDKKITTSLDPIYGINTGFGSLCDVKIDSINLVKLQENLVRSHACGTGDLVPESIVKMMLLLKIKSLSFGYSGVQLETVERLVAFYNHDILPIVYTQGSLGASGDLAPLAHLALPLLGEGMVCYNGTKLPTSEVFDIFGWQSISLQSKEGLALLNGTQFMAAYGIHCLLKSYKLSYMADLISSISLDAFDGRIEPFDSLIHLLRPHDGQMKTAERIKSFLMGSELMLEPKTHVQDPYSFRCIPQVHGATKDTLKFVQNTFVTEINAVTDNPNIFTKEDKIISGGNFHGQPLAFGFDFLKIAMAEIGNISERRTYQLVSGLRGLPAFLVNNSGLNSGLMIPQYTAASIVSANKQLATPASIDSIVSSNGQEDHVSMGANSAVQAYIIIDNVERVLAIELFNASQALFFKDKSSSPFLNKFINKFRLSVPLVSTDRIFHEDIENSIKFIQNTDLDNNDLLF